MFHTSTPKNTALHRLHIAKGHLKAVIRMCKNSANCFDIHTQLKAIQGELKSFDQILLKTHMEQTLNKSLVTNEVRPELVQLIRLMKQE